ncbi:hypothetical protein GCM10009111_25750 [Colwellia asteriadis]|uniref:Uncharacterized protein n=1 Tax=Colwellia asteriadis TaxID=517723 RepID=A0ABN1L8Z8_9GAMM
MIINTNSKTIKPYESTAYKGKANPYYRENIAGPKARKGHLAKAQCQLGVFPRVKITGICWDIYQDLTQYSYIDIYQKLRINDNELRLPLDSSSLNVKEILARGWFFLHLTGYILLSSYLLIGFLFGGWENIHNDIDLILIGFPLLLISKYLHRLCDKLNLVPTGQYVIFNRRTGMVEITNDERSGYHYLPFEQFNAHHRILHNERGHPSYGFTLLHYQLDVMYQVAHFNSVEDALVHWELIKNFMNIEVPLSDIPQFERYRQYDPTTINHDNKHKRPFNFWYRVDKKFIKKVKKISGEVKFKFPSKGVNTLHEALQCGYKVPDICYYPWREADSISDEILAFKAHWFPRYFVYPMLFDNKTTPKQQVKEK